MATESAPPRGEAADCAASSPTARFSGSAGSGDGCAGEAGGEKRPYWLTVKNSSLPPEFWDERRKLRNVRRKERAVKNKKERLEKERIEAELAAQEAGLDAEAVHAREMEASKRRVEAHLIQQARVEEATRTGLKIAIECGAFQGAMSDKEKRSLSKQLSYCKSTNGKSPRPAALHFTGYSGFVKEFTDGMGAAGWSTVGKHEGHVDEAFPKEDVVLMSPDAEEVLWELDPSRVYCVGGLVDRVILKGKSRRWGEGRGLRTARLPLPEVLPAMPKAGFVLNVNTVVEILLHIYAAPGDWEGALAKALPQNAVQKSSRAPKRQRREGAAGGQGVEVGEGGGGGEGDGAGEGRGRAPP